MKVAEVINQMFTQKGNPGHFYLALIRFLKNVDVHHTIILYSATNSAYGTISTDMSII